MRRSRFPVIRVAPIGALALAVIIALTGCAGKGSKPGDPDLEEISPPTWVLTGSPPEITGAVCAIGVAGPTYFRTDAVDSACESARSALARTLSVRVQTAMLDIQTGGGGRRETQSVVEVSSYVNEVVLEGSKIIEVWYDEQGRGFAQKPDYTYALGCIDAGSVSSVMPKP